MDDVRSIRATCVCTACDIFWMLRNQSLRLDDGARNNCTSITHSTANLTCRVIIVTRNATRTVITVVPAFPRSIDRSGVMVLYPRIATCCKRVAIRGAITFLLRLRRNVGLLLFSGPSLGDFPRGAENSDCCCRRPTRVVDCRLFWFDVSNEDGPSKRTNAFTHTIPTRNILNRHGTVCNMRNKVELWPKRIIFLATRK
jgi:hypothetical protein